MVRAFDVAAAARKVSAGPAGIGFARMAAMLARAKGDPAHASILAEAAFGETHSVTLALKSAATAVGTSNLGTAVDYQWLASEFISAVRPNTILGKLVGVRRIPENVKVPRETTSCSIGWVGEGNPTPVTGLRGDSISLPLFKLGGIVATTKELSRIANPAAEGLITSDLIAGVAAMTDRSFIDPTRAGEAGVSPPAINYGATSITATGTTEAALRADLRSLFGALTNAGIELRNPTLITDRKLAISLSLMDSHLTKNVTVSGGTLAGCPLITSSASPSGGASSPDSTSTLTLIDASEVLLADPGEATIMYSEEASLQMESAPDSPATAATVLLSLFQANMGAWRVTRSLNFKLRTAGAVAYISNCSYAE